LLFIYLLERGYPSSRVAFLTGNPGMLQKLKDYNNKNSAAMTKEEIASAYLKAWDDAGDGDDAWDRFVNNIESLPVPDEYIGEDVILQCSDYLEKNDFESLKQYINGISPRPVTGNDVQNTGDMMIYRFHEANLESPIFFTKKDHYIKGHDKGDAEQWLRKGRTDDRLTRWLILSAGNYVKSLFDENQNAMRTQMGNLFSGINTDPGIWSSFSQLYYLFYGLRDLDQKGPYYQAISAMLIPFDNSPKSSGPNAASAGGDYNKIQRAFARMSKQARNYCAHNYFGSSVSNRTALFIIMGTLSGILTKDQRQSLDNSWYKNVKAVIGSKHSYDVSLNVQKIDSLCITLIGSGDINLGAAFKYGAPATYANYKPLDVLKALGYYIKKDMVHQPDTSDRESYFVFTLAAYIIKWFEGMSEADILNSYGEGIKIIYELSNEIVDEYQYTP